MTGERLTHRRCALHHDCGSSLPDPPVPDDIARIGLAEVLR